MSAASLAGAVRIAAPAKLNLFLHIVGRRPDGYHLLDSLIAFASVHDTLVAAPAHQLTLTLDGPFGADLDGAGDDNLVLKAAWALAEVAGQPAQGALRLTKRLPVASGIGGGSADAAAAIKALVKLWRLTPTPEQLSSIALSLGADVPVCLAGHVARVGGIGEGIATVGRLPNCGLVLVNPRVPLATAAVFKARQGVFSRRASFDRMPNDVAGLAAALRNTNNDLEAPARALLPLIDDVLEAIAGLKGCLIARMSGSGATCFGLFADERAAQSASADLATRNQGWWVAPGRLLNATDDLVPL